MVKIWIHLEGLILFIFMLYFYFVNDFNWWVFLIFLFTPDISMLAYLINNSIGAVVYNIFHSYTISIPVLIFGLFMENNMLMVSGIIWCAHIGLDRLCGYGLKYKSDFKHTHLQKL